MRIFVTGGTGFVGSHFVEQALAAGHEVIALRRAGSKPRIALTREPAWVEGALDTLGVDDFHKIDALVHLAAHTPNPPYDSFAACCRWNVTASLAMAEAARMAGVARMVVAGSCFEYGQAAMHHERVPASALLLPTVSYPASKAAASTAFIGFARQHQVALRIERLFQVYGEGEPESRLWPALRRAAMEGRDFPMTAGEQLRDFIDVKDVAARLVHALDFADMTPGEVEITNVGTGVATSVRHFSEKWWAHWGATSKLAIGAVPYRANEMMRLVADTTPYRLGAGESG